VNYGTGISTGDVPLLEVTTAATGMMIHDYDVHDLPLRGRNPFALAQDVPGVTLSPGGMPSISLETSAYGGMDSFQINGIGVSGENGVPVGIASGATVVRAMTRRRRSMWGREITTSVSPDMYCVLKSASRSDMPQRNCLTWNRCTPSSGRAAALFALLVLVSGNLLHAQAIPADKLNPPGMFVGDMPSDPGPLANLSGAPDRDSVRAAMRKVADWQLARAVNHGNLNWTYATLYRGFLAASETLGDPRYKDFVQQVGKDAKWGLDEPVDNADNEAIGQSYAQLYALTHDATMIEPMRRNFDQVMSAKQDNAKILWWWADALFMAPTAWVQLSNVTHDPKYCAFMDQQWGITSRLLYSPTDHLFSRDQSYLYKHERNGRGLYWARGNGWVLAGLVGVMQNLPARDPRLAKYEAQYRAMVDTIAGLQGADGLWRSGLLDQAAYPRAEVSGSSFFIYAMAWGIEKGLLDRQYYLPRVQKGWAGLVRHIYADGRLGSIQPIGGAPGPYEASSSFVFGVGAFLMAGSEMEQLAVTQ
jgi:rhamnogalacturonyl hydrolase YesR